MSIGNRDTRHCFIYPGRFDNSIHKNRKIGKNNPAILVVFLLSNGRIQASRTTPRATIEKALQNFTGSIITIPVPDPKPHNLPPSGPGLAASSAPRSITIRHIVPGIPNPDLDSCHY
jgi:hypothetical protein